MVISSIQKMWTNVQRTLVEDSPLGDPRLAAFLDSDDAFMIYRHFGFLHARLLLYKQDELKEMEEKLRTMDLRDSKDAKKNKCLKSRRKDDLRQDLESHEMRKHLMQRIEKKTLEYGSPPVFY